MARTQIETENETHAGDVAHRANVIQARRRGSTVAEDRRFELLRGCPQHAFQACAWRSRQAGTVRELRSRLAVGTGEPRCTQADETTNETLRSEENWRWRAGWARSPAVDARLALYIPHRWLSEGGRLRTAAETLLFRSGPIVSLIVGLPGPTGRGTAGLHRRRRRTLSAGSRLGRRPGRRQRPPRRTSRAPGATGPSARTAPR